MKQIAAFFIFFVYSFAFAQNEDVIGFFKAELFNGNTYLTWRINQGYSCNGVKIERSTDSLNFVQISSIEGVCGSVTEHTDYDYTDTDPVENAQNFYRLNLQGVGYTWVVSVVVLNLDNDYMVYPHPIESNSKLYFNNNDGSEHILRIYNMHGVVVWETSTFDTYFAVTDELSSGAYFFTIRGASSKLVQGKLVF